MIRRLGLFLILSLSLTGSLFAATNSGSLTAAASACTRTAGVAMALDKGDQSATIQLAGTFVGTVTFTLSSNGGATYVAAAGLPVGLGAPVSTATSTGGWTFDVAGKTNICAYISSYTSGTVNVSLNSSGTSVASSRFPVVGQLVNTSLVGSGTRCVTVGATGLLAAAASDCGSGSGNLSGSLTATRVPFASAATTLVDDADMTFVTDTLTVTKLVGSTSITDSALTSGRVTFAGTGGLLADDADLTFTGGDTLNATNLIVSGTCTGCGTGTVTTSGSPSSSYMAFFSGATAITGDTSITYDTTNGLVSTKRLTGLGLNTGDANTNTYFGATALDSLTSGTLNTAVGVNALTANTSGAGNVAVGASASAGNTEGFSITAVGYSAAIGATGSELVAIGREACSSCAGDRNIAIGKSALAGLTSGVRNIAIGHAADVTSATSNDQLAIGSSAAANYFILGNLTEIAITPTVRANGGLKSSDGSTGASTTCTIAMITAIVVKNGLIISCT